MLEACNSFSEDSQKYSEARPLYPGALYQWLVAQCAQRQCAWDCAAGNGQAAVGLSPFFDQVIATDISPEQIKHGMARENIQYSVATAEHSGLDSHSVDLIVVAQALHWFDYDEFWKEVSRVGTRSAMFCAWGYSWLSASPTVDSGFVQPFRQIIEPFWAPNNRILWNGYQPSQVKFPFVQLNTPKLEIVMDWTPRQLLAYLQTWSAYKHALADPEAKARLSSLTDLFLTRSGATERLRVVMPLAMLAGRVET